eukprot:COSAG02_NODE_54561_length_295_cov_1.030612_1_plen_47_part_01
MRGWTTTVRGWLVEEGNTAGGAGLKRQEQEPCGPFVDRKQRSPGVFA